MSRPTLIDRLNRYGKIERNPAHFDIGKLWEVARRDLAPREEEILRLLYARDGVAAMTLRECAERMGVTYARIQQIRDKALRRLRRLDRLNQYWPQESD